MPLLLLGATGMLGQAVAAEAARRQIAVLGAARRGTPYAVDLADAAAVAALIDATRPTLIVNAAAVTDLDACERDPGAAYAVNARAVAVIAERCAAAGSRLVQISTDHYFTGDAASRHDEAAPVTLVNEYARTKFAGEAFALTAPNALVLRTNIAGWRGWAGRPSFAEWACAALASRRPLRLFEDYYTSTIDTGSFAHALFDLLARGATGTLNLASRSVSSKRQFVHRLAAALDIRLDWDEPARIGDLPTPRAASLGLDIGRAEALLGYALPDADTVCRALASHWMRLSCSTTPA